MTTAEKLDLIGEIWDSIDQATIPLIRFSDFPYGLFYRIKADEVEVFACRHAKRHPARWQRRAQSLRSLKRWQVSSSIIISA